MPNGGCIRTTLLPIEACVCSWEKGIWHDIRCVKWETCKDLDVRVGCVDWVDCSF